MVCNMFGAKLAELDLTAVTDGEYLLARATNINCPS